MMGFGSEDMARNGGHYNPPGGMQYGNSFAKSDRPKWGESSATAAP
jgi:hypothetical protein